LWKFETAKFYITIIDAPGLHRWDLNLAKLRYVNKTLNIYIRILNMAFSDKINNEPTSSKHDF
jgi:translation elongation factor EF-1alpha